MAFFSQRTKARYTLLLSPKSSGRWFHWQPVRIRKMTPSKASRSSLRLRPVGAGGS